MFTPGAGGPSVLLLNVTVQEGDEGESHEDDDILSIEVPLHARCAERAMDVRCQTLVLCNRLVKGSQVLLSAGFRASCVQFCC